MWLHTHMGMVMQFNKTKYFLNFLFYEQAYKSIIFRNFNLNTFYKYSIFNLITSL